jgi:hypothetical protein
MIPGRFTRRNAICRKPDERRSEQAKLQHKTSEEELNLRTAKRRLSTRGNEQPRRVKEVVAAAVAVAGYTNSKPVMPTRYERQPTAQQLEEMGDEFMSLSDLAGMAAQQLESALERGAFTSRRLVVVDEDTDAKKQGCIDKIKDSSVSIIPAVSTRRRSLISIMA